MLITSAAEAPGLAIAALLVDVKGRIWCIRSGMLLCAGSILGLLVASTHAVQLVLLFCARACVEGTFCVLYVFTPEQYPTHVRSFGLALCNSFSRFGGLAAPFVTVYLVEQGRSGAAETLLGTLCLLAAVAATLLPHETKGRDLNAVALAPDGAVGDINGTRNGGIESSLAERQPLNEMHSHRI